jgi:hypothetical protein
MLLTPFKSETISSLSSLKKIRNNAISAKTDHHFIKNIIITFIYLNYRNTFPHIE